MSVAQLIVTCVISILVTLPAVLLIPRARQSPAFDRVLWLGTGLMAFLSAMFVLGNVNVPGLNILVIGEVSVFPALMGAAIGAFLLNGLLWLMDHFSRPLIDESAAPEEASEPGNSDEMIAGEEDNDGDSATRASQ